MAAQLMSQFETMGKKIHHDQAIIEKLTYEIAQLKRFKLAKRSEQLNPQQTSLPDDLIEKFADHLPLCRQESIFGWAGLAISRSTLAQWVGVTGVQL
ncbi:Transposase component [Pseudomonas syringae pv. ribicola]|uniref:Transposase component n=1 Tax=Pseudomonas syringae pv. ribicola TaxID=55398 RepID=A0A3M2VLQ6_PSESI|nr:Transposase component [Pseudomonas syringae pv. ribicola]